MNQILRPKAKSLREKPLKVPETCVNCSPGEASNSVPFSLKHGKWLPMNKGIRNKQRKKKRVRVNSTVCPESTQGS
jgi:hypothetical protein